MAQQWVFLCALPFLDVSRVSCFSIGWLRIAKDVSHLYWHWKSLFLPPFLLKIRQKKQCYRCKSSLEGPNGQWRRVWGEDLVIKNIGALLDILSWLIPGPFGDSLAICALLSNDLEITLKLHIRMTTMSASSSPARRLKLCSWIWYPFSWWSFVFTSPSKVNELLRCHGSNVDKTYWDTALTKLAIHHQFWPIGLSLAASRDSLRELALPPHDQARMSNLIPIKTIRCWWSLMPKLPKIQNDLLIESA